jgi:hypothetical protein
VPYYLVNRYKSDRGLVFELGLQVPLSVPRSSTKEVEHFGFFGKEMVIINAELSSYLNPPVLKGRVYPVR